VFAASAEIHRHRQFFLLHDGGRVAARSSCGTPDTNTCTGPTATLARSSTNAAPDRPAAATSRPQFGSPPWIAVLHQRRVRDRPRREPGVFVSRGARDADGDKLGGALAAAHDLTRKETPTPPAVPPAAPDRRLCSIVTPEAPDASRNTQSLVEHSPSTVMALNVSSATLRSAPCNTSGATSRR
jgi:hypothetical protein